jgi:hypothetical protein
MVSALGQGAWSRYLTHGLDAPVWSARQGGELSRRRWRIEDALARTKRLLDVAYVWTGSTNAMQLQMDATRRCYAVLVTICQQGAQARGAPLERLAVERGCRAFSHSRRAVQRGASAQLVAWLAEQAKLLGIATRQRMAHRERPHLDSLIWGDPSVEADAVNGAPTPVKSREYTEALAQDALIGGLNMAYQTGRVLAGPDDVILDLDFAGAYAAAMANLPTIDWDTVRLDSSMPPPDAADLPIQFYNIEFSFPEDERYPSQAVRFPDGLCFPLHGETTCTGVEVELARGLGASIKVRHALYLPPLRDTDGAVAPAFASFIADLTQRRNDVVIGKNPDGEAILGDLRVCDMINIKIERRVRLDYDMKRVPRQRP